MEYPTMSLNDIKALPVSAIANPKCCVLFLWATGPKLPEALDVLHAWGFEYATIGFVWVKLNPNGEGIYSGLGHYTKSNVELCLIGRRGRCPPVLDKAVKQVVLAPRGEHSRKPDIVRQAIVDLFGNELPRI